MRTIHKYLLTIADNQIVEMPYGSYILAVQVQHGTPCIWANVPTDTQSIVKRCIVTIGTGMPVPEWNHCYIGTYQLDSGRLVFHVFEDCHAALESGASDAD